jgi:hypothetical protein
VLKGLEDAGNVNGACKLDPTDQLSEVFLDDRDAKDVHVIVQPPDNGELILPYDEPELTRPSGHQHRWKGLLRNSQTLP